MIDVTYARQLLASEAITEAQLNLYRLAAEAVEKKGRPFVVFAGESQQIERIDVDHQFPGVLFCKLPAARILAFNWGELTAVYYDSDEE